MTYKSLHLLVSDGGLFERSHLLLECRDLRHQAFHRRSGWCGRDTDFRPDRNVNAGHFFGQFVRHRKDKAWRTLKYANLGKLQSRAWENRKWLLSLRPILEARHEELKLKERIERERREIARNVRNIRNRNMRAVYLLDGLVTGLGALERLNLASKFPRVARLLYRETSRLHLQRESDATFSALHPNARRNIPRRDNRASAYLTATEWQDGKPGAFSQINPTLCRKKGDTLETSRGAQAPFSHAVAIFKLAQECRANGRTFSRGVRSIHAGHFTLDAIDAKGNITIGCHQIAYDEMLRLALRECPEIVRPIYPLPAIIAA